MSIVSKIAISIAGAFLVFACVELLQGNSIDADANAVNAYYFFVIAVAAQMFGYYWEHMRKGKDRT